ncbi:MAG: hypothetical protein HY260_23215 [Chloroflexi bacterium]|nr:hypothetical protein [Chloroflexota bacterium]
MAEERSRIASDSNKALLVLGVTMLVGVAGVVVFAAQAANFAQFFSIATVGVMIAGASLMSGALLGFLFGIPHTLQQNPEGQGERVGYRANTNLEQISDWLTKILVGVGLTQLSGLPGKLQQVASYLGSGLGNSNNSNAFALAILIYFVVCGFLFGFLWTRLFLAGALRQADLTALGALADQVKQTSQQVEKKLEELGKQSQVDAAALSLAQRQLNPSTDTPPPTLEELKAAIIAATAPVKVTLFNQSQLLRSENWRDDKPKMERSIPIFRALIASENGAKFHRNHGQLGFALKDQRNPDWTEAEAELTKAIEIRGSWQTEGWLFYEFNRAICRIVLDKDYQQDMKSKAEARQRIFDDLSAVSQSELKGLIPKVPEIGKWMSLNKITGKDLRPS